MYFWNLSFKNVKKKELTKKKFISKKVKESNRYLSSQKIASKFKHCIELLKMRVFVRKLL